MPMCRAVQWGMGMTNLEEQILCPAFRVPQALNLLTNGALKGYRRRSTSQSKDDSDQLNLRVESVWRY